MLVEHHEYFRVGYDALAAFVDNLSAFCKRLKWAKLETICSRACLIRLEKSGDVHVRFYTDNFWLQNEADQSKNFVLFRRMLPEETFVDVTFDGRYVDCERKNDVLMIPLSLNAKQEAEIRVEHGKFNGRTVDFRQSRARELRVFIRRYLSECRDNYVDRNLFLKRIGEKARKLFAGM